MRSARVAASAPPSPQQPLLRYPDEHRSAREDHRHKKLCYDERRRQAAERAGDEQPLLAPAPAPAPARVSVGAPVPEPSGLCECDSHACFNFGMGFGTTAVVIFHVYAIYVCLMPP
ncbi:hypothetical protein BDA96_10G311300 [Sorghum bicolor]|uniref:Uncharacterized protein n=2 Tax=Sorghum bicolor TaxID=4558 RepID=A0A194YL44_SORBI|nr:uncharacterized protein LOC110430770 [Sorghum bicolor]KAG0515833.1 hypothetical protein BDA96_10G311300 [Sorghum bicolor]KXG20695.1 hypothetical protein SORBI_3010G240200 [Sorghum bicolor]|eukprot:XP_021304375.1 uncharacterized protein LOC110430770 [Sorghum bicolor]